MGSAHVKTYLCYSTVIENIANAIQSTYRNDTEEHDYLERNEILIVIAYMFRLSNNKVSRTPPPPPAPALKRKRKMGCPFSVIS